MPNFNVIVKLKSTTENMKIAEVTIYKYLLFSVASVLSVVKNDFPGLHLLWTSNEDAIALPVQHLLFFFLSLLVTATLQIGYRQFTGKLVSGVRTPAAWRTIPYLLLIHYAG